MLSNEYHRSNAYEIFTYCSCWVTIVTTAITIATATTVTATVAITIATKLSYYCATDHFAADI